LPESGLRRRRKYTIPKSRTLAGQCSTTQRRRKSSRPMCCFRRKEKGRPNSGKLMVQKKLFNVIAEQGCSKKRGRLLFFCEKKGVGGEGGRESSTGKGALRKLKLEKRKKVASWGENPKDRGSRSRTREGRARPSARRSRQRGW